MSDPGETEIPVSVAVFGCELRGANCVPHSLLHGWLPHLGREVLGSERAPVPPFCSAALPLCRGLLAVKGVPARHRPVAVRIQ